MSRSRAYPGLVKVAMRQGLSVSRGILKNTKLLDHQHNVIDGMLLAFVASIFIWILTFVMLT